ncbi:hypothetical protein CC80DRAFT_284983 [Byssothecium circinans]|uniref:Type 1 phosphatases regulator n=1 Tax=Byssothecium circinans TaxID=147558 RepID=A0A6A5U602_9PLEO|nr:hypothetical protein CC80DRAFT_284983 [Byssothecium circinans]
MPLPPTHPSSQTAPASFGSLTTTTTPTTNTPQPVLRLTAPSGTLRLRAESTEQRHIQWAEDVVDNEGLGKKSSKGSMKGRKLILKRTVCCIYHKPREVSESSDESSSDSSSSDESDSEPDNSTARPAGGQPRGRGRRALKHNHDRDGDCDHDHDHGDVPAAGKPKKKARRPRRKPSPNAYEKMPQSQK